MRWQVALEEVIRLTGPRPTGPDKSLVVAWRKAFESYSYPGELTSEQRDATYTWQNRLNKTDAFIAKLKRYVADC